MGIQNRIAKPNGITAAGERSDQDNSPAAAHAGEPEAEPAHRYDVPRIVRKSSGTDRHPLLENAPYAAHA